jgi:hypothetical protein
LSSAIVFGLAVSSFGGIAVAMPNPGAQQQQAVTLDQQKAVLSQYGQFTTLPQYGEVWVPSGLPQGWHPYPPCNWVFEKTLGWYYDDKTAWGAIVHHYGRWTSDPQLGWVWVPGKEFSPGWVVWRASPDWDGWAPLPPDADLQTISAQSFDTDKDWIFAAAKDFGKCGTQVQATPQIFRDTQVVREVRYVGGIFVPIFPTYIVAPIVVDLNIRVVPVGARFHRRHLQCLELHLEQYRDQRGGERLPPKQHPADAEADHGNQFESATRAGWRTEAPAHNHSAETAAGWTITRRFCRRSSAIRRPASSTRLPW